MNFTPISEQEFFQYGFYKKTKLNKFVQQFIDAAIPVAAVDWESEYANVKSCQSALMQATKRMQTNHIKVIIRENKCFLLNELLIEKLI